MTDVTQPSTKPKRKGKQSFAALHARPLPFDIHPLPAFVPQNPLSLLRIAYVFLSQYFNPPAPHSLPNGRVEAYYSAATRSVHVVDPAAIRFLWECGFFGKGNLSRSEPEWLERERRRRGLIDADPSQTAAEVTRKRREERRDVKRERARVEREALEMQLREEGKLPLVEVDVETKEDADEDDRTLHGVEDVDESEKKTAETEGPLAETELSEAITTTTYPETTTSTQTEQPTTIEIVNQEHLQLAPSEAFFLSYGLGVLNVVEPSTKAVLSNSDLLSLLRKTSTFPPSSDLDCPKPDDFFILNYVVYHHFRSLGWVVRPGIKFSVDYLLYNRGPVFSHAEFAVLIMPSYSHEYWSATPERKADVSKKERKPWWWLHGANRVQNQVRKSLVLVYVEVPPPPEMKSQSTDIGELLRSYRVREFVLKRWSANRNRD